MELWGAMTTLIGGQMVARAWLDPAYKSLLLDDARAAVNQYPGPVSDHFQLVCLEQTATTHNLLVCVPCSCYPTSVVGPVPAWYKDPSYRGRAFSDPRGLLASLGTTVPVTTAIVVHNSDLYRRYMVLPLRPTGTATWTEDQLAALVDEHNIVGASLIPPQS